jgi:hypothetical protein
MIRDMNQVISFSLYGNRRIYCEGALRNLELAPVYYPGWRCRIYIDETVPQFYQKQLIAGGAEIIKVTKKSLGPMYGKYWRYWVAGDNQVDRFIVRDIDSRLNPRERAAVDEWIASGKSFHLMRDIIYHSRYRALGGMWGGIGGKLPLVADLTDRWGLYDQHGQSDRFVSEVLFPFMKDDYICHDGTGNCSDNGRSFPPHPPLVGTRYVGEIIEVDKPPIDIWRQSAEFENCWQLTLQRLNKLEQASKIAAVPGMVSMLSCIYRMALPVRWIMRRARRLGKSSCADAYKNMRSAMPMDIEQKT